MVTLMPCNYLNAQTATRCTMIDKMCEPKVKRVRMDQTEPAERDRPTDSGPISPQSGHTSSSCGSPPTAAPPSDPRATAAPSCLANFAAAAAAAWPLLDTQGVKSEIKSPGLGDADVTAALTAQDAATSAPFYGASPAELGAAAAAAAYDDDKDYPQAYASAAHAQAHQYYNSMHQAYGSSPATSYMSTTSSGPFYTAPTYPYSPLGPSRGLNASCKASGYIAAPYGSPATAFGAATAQGGQYSPYATYGSTGGGAASFAQGFAQGVEYAPYSSTYAESQTSQYAASTYYASQSYSPYVSSPSSSGSIGASTYQLAATSLSEIYR